jgi:hypothetical protein
MFLGWMFLWMLGILRMLVFALAGGQQQSGAKNERQNQNGFAEQDSLPHKHYSRHCG